MRPPPEKVVERAYGLVMALRGEGFSGRDATLMLMVAAAHAAGIRAAEDDLPRGHGVGKFLETAQRLTMIVEKAEHLARLNQTAPDVAH